MKVFINYFFGFFCSTSDQSSSVLDADSCDMSPDKVSKEFIDFVRDWAVTNIHSMRNNSLTDLLNILRLKHSEFPRTAETFLKTKKEKNLIRPMLGKNDKYGSFVYFGLATALKRMIDLKIFKEKKIKILVNVDGSQNYNQSTQQFWTILIGLPSDKYIVPPEIVAIFHGTSKPKDPHEFLEEFIDEVIKLMENNVTIENVTFEFEIFRFVCDTPARAFLKCIVSHTAFYSCERCTIEGKSIEGKKKNKKTKRVFGDMNCSERDKESFEKQTQKEHHHKNEVSPLLRIPNFDPVKQVVLDSMHLLFLGISKTLLTTILFGGPKTRSIGVRHRILLGEIFRDFKGQIPAEFQRKTFDISNVKIWKGTQFRFFLLYGSALVLREVLKPDKYRHFCLLYVACRLLCSEELAVQNVKYAKKLLRVFFHNAPKFYGPGIQSLNFHNLIHIADDVETARMALSLLSAFTFENFLMTLKKYIRAPNNPLGQVCNRLREIRENSVGLCRMYRRSENRIEIIEKKTVMVIWNGFMITTKAPDNVVLLKNNKILQIDSIKVVKNDVALSKNNVSLKGTLYETKGNLFSFPNDSSEVGIYKVKLTTKKYDCSFDDVQCKFVNLKVRQSTYCIKMLHC